MANEKKTGTGNRRQFVRTNIPLAERVASAIKGKHFDPNLFTVRTDSLKSTAAAVEGNAGTSPSTPETKPAAGEENSAEGGMDYSSDTPKPVAKGEPMEISLAGLKPMSATEFYNSDNLFEKIDGRAPAYQGFNVQQQIG